MHQLPDKKGISYQEFHDEEFYYFVSLSKISKLMWVKFFLLTKLLIS